MIQRLLLFIFLSASLLAPLQAQEANPPPDSTASTDRTIESRLETIFANVDDLEKVGVTVRNGVVRLEGQTSGEVAREKAEQVAKGLDGVVYVDNDIVQTNKVGERLSPGLKRLNQFVDSLRGLLPLLGVAVGILLVFWLIARLAGKAFERIRWLRSNLLLRSIVGNLIRVVVMLVGTYLALEVVGATAVVGAVLGAAGVAGLAISFAFRDIIENYLASVILSIRQPFRIKDKVEINGLTGRVIRLTSSETVLMTDDGNHVRLPNSDVFKGTITNFTRNPRRRLSIPVGIGTGEDLDDVEAVGLSALRGIPGIMADPPPLFSVEELGDSSVIVRFHAWVDQRAHDFLKARSLAVRTVKDALDTAEIEMPAPIYEVNLHRGIKPKSPPRPAPVPADPPVTDLSPEDHIDAEIDEEQRIDPGDNLLAGPSTSAGDSSR
ncbi:mechanosensitive ion channel family protein [Luteolibacter marinus]|uniref:mechanosensitive ion channel family protein n=1 Tax=Luteolibacter marinus TaxID=2776705 RepID=UPI001867133D|nr:mechanosensitive ion channel family protein [Luteolibacter marinus]